MAGQPCAMPPAAATHSANESLLFRALLLNPLFHPAASPHTTEPASRPAASRPRPARRELRMTEDWGRTAAIKLHCPWGGGPYGLSWTWTCQIVFADAKS
jgi:hypothetical protein